MAKHAVIEEDRACLVSHEEPKPRDIQSSSGNIEYAETHRRHRDDVARNTRVKMLYAQFADPVASRFHLYLDEHSKMRLAWTWKVEIVACLGAWTALTAIFIFVEACNGLPEHQWPFRFSLNSVVSALGLVLKSCLLYVLAECISQLKWLWFRKPRELSDMEKFDEASRGIRGSLNLMLSLRMKRSVTIGALITVLTFAVDPFLQAVLQYSVKSLIVDNIAQMPVSRAYEPSPSNLTGFNAPLLWTVYSALLGGEDQSPQVSVQCRSGNCTFNEYDTLGFCSNCVSASPYVNTTFYNSTEELFLTNPEYDQYITYNSLHLNATLSGSVQGQLGLSHPQKTLAMNVASGLQWVKFSDIAGNGSTALSFEMDRRDPNVGYSWGDFPVTFPQSNIKSIKMSDLFSQDVFTVIALGVTSVPCVNIINNTSVSSELGCVIPSTLEGVRDTYGRTVELSNEANTSSAIETALNNVPKLQQWPNVRAATCTLTLCQKSYRGSVSAGKLEEKLVRTSKLMASTLERSYDLQPSIRIPFECNLAGINYNLKDYINIESADRLMSNSEYDMAVYEELQRSSPNSSRLDACRYELGRPLLTETFAKELSDLFTAEGTFNRPADNSKVPIYQKSDSKLNPWSHGQDINWSSQPLAAVFADGVWSIGSMNDMFERIAEALTVHLRMSDRDKSHARGYTIQTDQYVHANTVWLVLPTILVLSTCLFLSMTILKSDTSGAEMTWKSSQSALLLHGFPNDGELGSLRSPRDIRLASESLKVKLSPIGTGWRLERVGDTPDGLDQGEIPMEDLTRNRRHGLGITQAPTAPSTSSSGPGSSIFRPVSALSGGLDMPRVSRHQSY